MGRLSVIGFNDKMSAVVESISHDIIASSEIEGVELNNEQVRSSVARKLGVQLPNPTESSRYIDGVVEMALDATVNFNSPLTHESPPFLLRDLQHVSCARCSLDIPSTFSITVRHGVSLVMGSPHNGQHWFCLSHMNMRDFLPFKLSFIRIRFLSRK